MTYSFCQRDLWLNLESRCPKLSLELEFIIPSSTGATFTNDPIFFHMFSKKIGNGRWCKSDTEYIFVFFCLFKLQLQAWYLRLQSREGEWGDTAYNYTYTKWIPNHEPSWKGNSFQHTPLKTNIELTNGVWKEFPFKKCSSCLFSTCDMAVVWSCDADGIRVYFRSGMEGLLIQNFCQQQLLWRKHEESP